MNKKIVIPVMPKAKRKHPDRAAALSLRPDTYRKIAMLKQQTGRSMSAIIAMLVDQAVAGK